MAILGIGSELDGGHIDNIGEITSLGFSMAVQSIDTTETTSAYQQSVPSTISAGAMVVSLLFDGSTSGEALGFIVELKRRKVSHWRIDFGGGVEEDLGNYQADGYITSASVAASVVSVITMNITIQLTGEPKFNWK